MPAGLPPISPFGSAKIHPDLLTPSPKTPEAHPPKRKRTSCPTTQVVDHSKPYIERHAITTQKVLTDMFSEDEDCPPTVNNSPATDDSDKFHMAPLLESPSPTQLLCEEEEFSQRSPYYNPSPPLHKSWQSAREQRDTNLRRVGEYISNELAHNDSAHSTTIQELMASGPPDSNSADRMNWQVAFWASMKLLSDECFDQAVIDAQHFPQVKNKK